MSFTPLASLAGGALIGVSASLMLLLDGRVAGISGILGGAVRPGRGDTGWRVAFLAGLVAGAIALALLHPAAITASDTGVALPIVVGAGLLVGVGTQLGSGCTSGHGVCGISRLSVRSMVATLTFMVTGAVAAFVVQHVVRSAP
jgi:uncharacterized membrane protein YedE/YeeE